MLVLLSSSSSSSSADRKSKDALDALNSLQTPHHVLQERRRLGKKAQDSYIKEQRVYLRRLGYAVSQAKHPLPSPPIGEEPAC